MKTFLEVAKYVVGAIAVVSAMTLLAIDKSLMPEGMIQKFFTQYGAYIGLTSLLLMLLADSLEVRIPDPIPFVHVGIFGKIWRHRLGRIRLQRSRGSCSVGTLGLGEPNPRSYRRRHVGELGCSYSHQSLMFAQALQGIPALSNTTRHLQASAAFSFCLRS